MVINHPHTITVTQAALIRIVSRIIIIITTINNTIITRESMPASNGAPIDSVDSSFGLTTPRGYSGAKEVCHFRGMNVILSVFARNPILTSSGILLQSHKVDVIFMISVFKVFNKQLGIYQRPMSAHGVSSLSYFGLVSRWIFTPSTYFYRRWGTSRTQHFHWLGAVDPGGLNFLVHGFLVTTVMDFLSPLQVSNTGFSRPEAVASVAEVEEPAMTQEVIDDIISSSINV